MNKLTTVKGISKKLVTKQKIQRAEVQGLWNIHTRILDLSNPESFFSFGFWIFNFRLNSGSTWESPEKVGIRRGGESVYIIYLQMFHQF
jgi:hypothetical protein